MSINELDFKLIDKIEPPVKNGKYTFTATQNVVQKGVPVGNYHATQEYAVSYTAFTLGTDEVFDAYPANGAVGNFSDTLPFITFNDRTLPWKFGGRPYIALLVLKNEEIIEQGDMAVKEIFTPVSGVYFPDKSHFPNIYTEEKEDLCSFIDISKQTYDDLFPSSSDLPLLAHSKLINLSQTPDKICSKDGYFSVVMANRFVPSDDKTETASSCHLVTTFGYGEKIPEDNQKVRLISLYHWTIRSHSEKGRPFTELISGLSKNCCEIGRGFSGGESSVKLHYTRTGELTYSVYHSPLISHENAEIPQITSSHTADGRLIYDKQIGIFDVSYASAFQLGRLITLSKTDIAAKVLSHRNDRKLFRHQLNLKQVETVDFELIGNGLLDYVDGLTKTRKENE